MYEMPHKPRQVVKTDVVKLICLLDVTTDSSDHGVRDGMDETKIERIQPDDLFDPEHPDGRHHASAFLAARSKGR